MFVQYSFVEARDYSAVKMAATDTGSISVVVVGIAAMVVTTLGYLFF